MAHETLGEASPHPWKATDLRTPVEDLKRNASLGFVRLARLVEMSLPLMQAYGIRLHPDTHLLLGDLTENLRHLTPADLGRFMALEYANGINHIYTKASDEPGLTLLVPDTSPYRRGPERDWCDATGNQHRLLRAPGYEYGRAMKYLDNLDTAVDAIAQDFTDEGAIDAYRQGYATAGSELVAAHSAHLEQARENGPILELDRQTEQDVMMLKSLDKLRTPPEPQSDGTTG